MTRRRSMRRRARRHALVANSRSCTLMTRSTATWHGGSTRRAAERLDFALQGLQLVHEVSHRHSAALLAAELDEERRDVRISHENNAMPTSMRNTATPLP